MEIKAAVVNEAGADFVLESLELDDPRENEVLVKIDSCGICHTDLSAKAQYVPFPLPGVLGHEGAGIVEKVGSRVSSVKPGDHVALSWMFCGECPACTSGQPTHCPDFLRLNFGGVRDDGTTTLMRGNVPVHGNYFGQSSFATYAIADERSIAKLPKEIPLEIAGPLGCGVMTGAGAVINSLKAGPGSSIAVFGTGTVGMSAVLGAVACGCTTIVAVDIHDSRLELARSLGATHTVNAGKCDVVKTVQELTKGGPDFSLECVGDPKVFRQAVDVLPLRGVCGLVGVVAPGTEVTFDMMHIMNGRIIRGVIEGDAVPSLFIPKLVELNRKGLLPYEKLIKYYDFADINKAVEDMGKGLVVKPVLRMR